MAFEFASTNLVIELGIILAVLIGWQFTAAEFAGGPLMIIFLAFVFRAFLRPHAPSFRSCARAETCRSQPSLWN